MRILLIEDDDASAKSIELMLSDHGFTSERSPLGEEGLEIAKLYDYDLIILDLMLPDLDGYEVVRRLRSAKIQTPVLMLSGLSEPDHKIKGFQLGADDYLTKPFYSKEMIARVQRRFADLKKCPSRRLPGRPPSE